jgi:hypothetical protein
MLNRTKTLLGIIIAAFTGFSCTPQLIGVEKKIEATSSLISSGGSGSSGASGFSLSSAGLRGMQSAVGDFNHDGKLDIAMPNPTSNNVSVLLGNGAGGFAAAVDYAVSNTPIAVATADININGNLDLFVTTTNGDVEVLLGAGNGTFGASVAYPGVTGAAGITLGDFNKNGVTDTVFVDFVGNQVHIKLGTIAGA